MGTHSHTDTPPALNNNKGASYTKEHGLLRRGESHLHLRPLTGNLTTQPMTPTLGRSTQTDVRARRYDIPIDMCMCMYVCVTPEYYWKATWRVPLRLARLPRVMPHPALILHLPRPQASITASFHPRKFPCRQTPIPLCLSKLKRPWRLYSQQTPRPGYLEPLPKSMVKNTFGFGVALRTCVVRHRHRHTDTPTHIHTHAFRHAKQRPRDNKDSAWG